MKKGGLGKGLEVLFAENTIEEEGKTVSLPINDIEPNRGQPRKQFDDAALADLTASIAQHGVLQPLLVRPIAGGNYQLVAGERRWRASRMAGLAEVPVVIREMTDQEAAELALIENLQREDLNPMEEAMGYRTLMESYGMTQEETAKAVNKSRPAVTNALRLLHLPETVTRMVAGGELSAGHARAILAFETEEEQLDAAAAAVDRSLSVRELEKMVKAARSPAREKEKERKTAFSRPPFCEEVELALTEHMGRRVKVSEGAKSGGGALHGTLQIEFFSEEDLQSLANRLAPPPPKAPKPTETPTHIIRG